MSDHNLDVSSYSFYELLDLFQLNAERLTAEDLQRAKKKVLFMHPDRSKLPKEYFIFYKQAFSIIVRIYENTLKTKQHVPQNQDLVYHPENEGISSSSSSSSSRIQKTIGKIPPETFQQQFNQLFENHMQTKIDPEKNKWFQDESAIYEDLGEVKNTGQMRQAFDAIKERTQQMTLFTEVTPLCSGNGNNNLYDEDGMVQDDESRHHYISSDPFSKLKFDDLRKVHKDQTVFSVSERDIDKIPQYKSVDAYQRARGNDYVPMEREAAKQMLETQEQQFQSSMRQKQYRSQLHTLESERKNQAVMAQFLRLGY